MCEWIGGTKHSLRLTLKTARRRRKSGFNTYLQWTRKSYTAGGGGLLSFEGKKCPLTEGGKKELARLNRLG